MKSSVLFIFTPFAGHLNKTTLLARHYAQKGAEITYLISAENSSFKPDFPCKVILTKYGPVGTPRKTISDDLNHKHVVIDPDLAFAERRKVLQDVIIQCKATLIFIDCFCAYDYMLVYEQLRNIRTIFIEPWVPNLPGEGVPPLHSKCFPGRLATLEWLWNKLRIHFKLIYDYSIHSEANLIWILNKLEAEKKQIPKFRFYANKFPMYPEIEWWYMYPKELDFFERKLPTGYRYMGPAIDLHRKQEMPTAVEVFLNLVSKSESKTLIYCTFGTVIKSFQTDEVMLSFYEKLNQLALKHPEWHILVSTTSDLLKRIRPKGMNIMFASNVPQLEILKHASVCINHGGGGTVLECAVAGVPMLCVPAADKVDYNGNSTRVEYHKIGVQSTFNASDEEIEGLIKKLIINPVYTSNARQMSEKLNLIYSADYLHFMDLPEV